MEALRTLDQARCLIHHLVSTKLFIAYPDAGQVRQRIRCCAVCCGSGGCGSQCVPWQAVPSAPYARMLDLSHYVSSSVPRSASVLGSAASQEAVTRGSRSYRPQLVPDTRGDVYPCSTPTLAMPLHGGRKCVGELVCEVPCRGGLANFVCMYLKGLEQTKTK